MSNLVKKEYPPDMNEHDIRSLEQYIEEGLPGVSQVSQEKLKQAIEMYLDGYTYFDIASRVGIKKKIILYISHKHNFYEMKMDNYKNMMQSLGQKFEVASIKSAYFLTDLMSSIESYYREMLVKYQVSKDPRIMESEDFKKITTYLKVLEQVQKIANPPEKDHDKKGPFMGINLPHGGILRKIDDNTLEVSTPSSQVSEAKLGEVLAALAKSRETREEGQ